MSKVRTVTSAQMREIDHLASSEYGIQPLVLMENAGRQVAKSVLEFKPKNAVIVCGSGNNGGDGIVASRFIKDAGVDARVVLMKSPDELSPDAAVNLKKLSPRGVPYSGFDGHAPFRDFDVIVDALVGTGFKGKLEGSYLEAVLEMNSSGRPVISVDIPSGLDADSGISRGVTVQAAVTVTLGCFKPGLERPEASAFVGKLVLADIGIPEELLQRYACR